MAPSSGLHQSAIPSDFEAPFPPLVRSSTAPIGPRSHSVHSAHRSHLAPEDAYAPLSPPRRLGPFDGGRNGSGTDSRPNRGRRNDSRRSRSRRRKRFQKLLWVKQSYPDNYTDQATFLEKLQRNPRVRPYDFWPLVADSTVIVQHVCSVIIFVVCFVGIFQERVSPVAVVGWSSFATFLGWLLWDWWVTRETQDKAKGADGTARMMRGGHAYRDYRAPLRQDSTGPDPSMVNASTFSISSTSNLPSPASSTSNLLQDQHQPQRVLFQPLSSSNTDNLGLLAPTHMDSRSVSPLRSGTSQASAAPSPNTTPRLSPDGEPDLSSSTTPPSPPPARNSRAYVRVSTIKSAILIYFTLLGLSPILKSLTRSTSSDSIWAMSFWLLAINIFFFDYSGSSWVGGSFSTTGTTAKRMPVASLSTNAALMASTVLASRLPSTGQVFSLTLFSIEVFGLFPVFRQYARHRSWRYHAVLTVLLVLGAGGGVGMILGDEKGWPWKKGLLGMVVGCLISALAMGGCSWWLIGLQKYKNEIYGPWDPARPIIISRRHWDDE
ncbi:phosphatidylinositol N-acetylglucosaminyltransferase-domain-containing protein [Chaetomium strumarium]|uniref:Phosphatidylinositol N-acetylglucosaminyltransferase-domain-containing protein n=1 Tax=Chaetomium strumarium TaxID=1170767 RepID=A0AAJ0H307_9PEZI|nr:phosphatidylinositol N-acetylglucosaminyltransferase-domain-containing protein [Chaetomium strumarium]